MEKYTQNDMIEFADWCRNGLTNLEYSNLYNNQGLLAEWERSKMSARHNIPNSDGLQRHIKLGNSPVTYQIELSEKEKALFDSKSK